MNDLRQYAPSAARNRDPILAVFRARVAAGARVLEIGSGSGEHAAHLCAALPRLDWQPSDPDAASRASVAAWIAHSGLRNIRPPLDLDVRASLWGVEGRAPFDVIVSVNMIHIAPWVSALGLVDGAARLLRDRGTLFLYGPFRRNGAHTAPSNAAFDASLRERNPEWGVRDLEDVVRIGAGRELSFVEAVPMPANNYSIIFERAQRQPAG